MKRVAKPFTPQPLPLPSLDWARLVSILGRAYKELARFDALLENVPDASLLLSPLTFQEAVSSSRIEGTQASLEDVLRFQAEQKAENEKRDDIQEVINYRNAMEFAFKRMEDIPLSGRLIKDAHKILLSGVRGKHKDPGKFRNGGVHIGSGNAPREQATYIPPQAQKIPQLFSNLEKYMHRKEKDVLVQLAIIHAQFEIIHPFWDGNGRIGRLLMPLFLYSKKAISTPYFYLSEYLEKNRDSYYLSLNRITKDGDWEQWVEFFLGAITEQSRINADKAQAIIDLKEKTLLRVQQVTHSQYTPQMVNFIFSSLWFAGTGFRDNANISHSSAQRLLNLLKQGRIIRTISQGKGRRPSLYMFPALVRIIG